MSLPLQWGNRIMLPCRYSLFSILSDYGWGFKGKLHLTIWFESLSMSSSILSIQICPSTFSSTFNSKLSFSFLKSPCSAIFSMPLLVFAFPVMLPLYTCLLIEMYMCSHVLLSSPFISVFMYLEILPLTIFSRKFQIQPHSAHLTYLLWIPLTFIISQNWLVMILTDSQSTF